MKNQKGFTLIELLLVLAIIGIISAIAIPALLGQRSRARDKSAVANADNIISDLVGGYDKARDANTAMATAAAFQTAVIGVAGTSPVPAFFSAANPWGGGTTAYKQTVVGETVIAGTTTVAAATVVGQTNVGFLPVAAPAPGAIVSAVLLNTAIGTGATTSTSYVKGVGVE